MNETSNLDTARMLVARLERLSADSYWAHQASGLRGSLLRCLEQVDLSQQGRGTDRAPAAGTVDQLDQLVDRGFEILVRAAQEVASKKVLSNESN